MQNCQTEQIIFLPGWSFKTSIWNDIINSLPEYHTIKCDFTTTTNLVQELLAVANKQSIIVAWSMSGLFAIDFCYQYPHLCKQLILVSSLPKFVTNDSWDGIPKVLAQRFLKNSKQNLTSVLNHFHRLIQKPYYSYTISKVLEQNHSGERLYHYLEYLFTTDYRDLLKSLVLPITAYFGSHDSIIPTQASQQLPQINSNLVVKTIYKAGHLLFLTHKQKFLQSLKDDIHAHN